jgi:hypothetical protein
VYTYTIYITLNCRRTLYIVIFYINCLTGSLNIYIGKTPVFNSSTLFGHLSANGKLYYSSGLFLNKSIDLTSIGL